MKLSTRARYGTRALLDIAIHSSEGPVLLKDIAQRQEVSLAYLEHLIAPLRAAGIVRSTRGPGGGIWLARLPQEVKLGQIVKLYEGSTAPVDCVDNPDLCRRNEFCVARSIWGELKKALDGVLESMTLQDLVERQEHNQQPGAAMYNI